jgi:hypothetical protein
MSLKLNKNGGIRQMSIEKISKSKLGYILLLISNRRKAIENRMKFNQANEEEILQNRKSIKEGRTNPWEKVVQNLEIKESDYKGSKDISRMRHVILNRKNDFVQMKMK